MFYILFVDVSLRELSERTERTQARSANRSREKGLDLGAASRQSLAERHAAALGVQMCSDFE